MQNTIANVIGVSLSVPENPYNTLAEQLSQKERELGKKEQMINEREVALSGGITVPNNIIVYGAVISFILFVLVVLNFYLDWIRTKRPNFL